MYALDNRWDNRWEVNLHLSQLSNHVCLNNYMMYVCPLIHNRRSAAWPACLYSDLHPNAMIAFTSFNAWCAASLAERRVNRQDASSFSLFSTGCCLPPTIAVNCCTAALTNTSLLPFCLLFCSNTTVTSSSHCTLRLDVSHLALTQAYLSKI